MRVNWQTIFRIIVKAALLFVLLNLVFAAIYPLDELGRVSLYNRVFRGRERLPYGENPEESYSLSLNNMPAMFASHVVSRSKEADEFRVIVLGDSGAWGWLLENGETLAGAINQAAMELADGRQVTAYNLGYPIMSITKDLLLLDEALSLQPDMIIWPITLQSFQRASQLDHPILRNNSQRVRSLIREFGLDLDAEDERFIDPSFFEKTIVGQRRALADLLRLQLYGASWSATGIDQAIPDEKTLRATDLEADPSWLDIKAERRLTDSDLIWESLEAGVTMADGVPVVIVNEPIFISDGANSDIRYNAWYPRWAYDDYRMQLQELAEEKGWRYLDFWDEIEPEHFTDSPVHLDPAGMDAFAGLLLQAVPEFSTEN